MRILLFEIITQYSLWFVPLCLATGVLFAYVLYRTSPKNDELVKPVKWFLFSSRTLLIATLAFFLLNPLIKKMVNEKEKPIILIAQDNSSSLLNAKDSAFIKNEFVKALKTVANDLSEKYDVKFYRFDSKTELNDTINFKGKETDYSSLFNEIENNYTNRNVGALILASDGLYNKGSNPVYGAEKLKFPVYTIALGDTTTLKDALVKKVDHNDVAYLGNKFPVEITVDARKLQGKESVLTVSKQGKKVGEQRVVFNTTDFTKTISFLLDADKPGVQKFLVSLAPVAEEQNKLNNSQPFVIEVIDNREKIAIISGAPHPDVAAIKESIEENQNYEVETFLAAEFNSSVKPYSLVILNQLQINSAAGTKIMNDLTANNTSYFLVSAYGGDKIPGVNVQAMNMKYNDAEAIVNKSFSLFTVSDEFKKYAKEFPAVKSILGNYSIANSATIFMTQRIGVVETENPLLLFNTNGEQKSGVFLGDGLWRWKLRDFADHENHDLFNELVSKIVQYLSVKADKSFFRVKTRKVINENEEVELEAEVYNNSYELITEPEVTIVITNESDKKFNYTFSKTGLGYRLNVGILPPGEYSYKATTNNGTKAQEQRGFFTVKEIVAEKINAVADHKLLQQLSTKSNGKFFYANQLTQLKDLLANNENIKTITYSHKDVKDLIDIKTIFFILLALLSLEWFIRKRNGLY
ncbi:MAG: hypothetical protein Q8M29_03700 [Bacteroidota bacterium]|nr:hypothetical protein [Bacteroidota bacterium]